jgi:hypothetical protein
VPHCSVRKGAKTSMIVVNERRVIMSRAVESGVGRNFRWSRSQYIFTDADSDINLKS